MRVNTKTYLVCTTVRYTSSNVKIINHKSGHYSSKHRLSQGAGYHKLCANNTRLYPLTSPFTGSAAQSEQNFLLHHSPVKKIKRHLPDECICERFQGSWSWTAIYRDWQISGTFAFDIKFRLHKWRVRFLEPVTFWRFHSGLVFTKVNIFRNLEKQNLNLTPGFRDFFLSWKVINKSRLGSMFIFINPQ